MKTRILLGAAGCVVWACGGHTVNVGQDGGGGDAESNDSSEGDGGATVVASEIQQTPTNLASDGTSLFWTSSVGGGAPLSSMPVGGGPITTVVPGPVPGGFLAVDDVNVYFLGQSGGIYRAPKNGGGSSMLVSEAGGSVGAATSLGSSAYWFETPEAGPGGSAVTVKRAPLLGGPVSQIANFTLVGPMPSAIGVTATTAFISGSGLPPQSISLGSGVLRPVLGETEGCELLVSDTDAVYCDTGSSIIAVQGAGSLTVLGTVVEDSPTFGGGNGDSVIAYDDTYVYWVDNATVGTMMRVPKTGGTATVIARDTSPVAIAVDANAIYWSNQAGQIRRLVK
jgi:hypothetical protein